MKNKLYIISRLNSCSNKKSCEVYNAVCIPINKIEVLDISRDAIFTLLKVVTPVLLVALFIGLIIGIFQALTQIQEMTLAFVPKIIGVFVTIILLFPFMLNQMKTLTEGLFDKIVSGG